MDTSHLVDPELRAGLADMRTEPVNADTLPGLRQQRAHDGDELIMFEPDRLGCSRDKFLTLVDELIKRGVQLRVLVLPSLDIETNYSRLIADILASLAVQQRRRLRERQRQGIAAARLAGRHLGCAQKMNGQQVGEARVRLVADKPIRIISQAYGVRRKTFRAMLARSIGCALAPVYRSA